MGPEPKKSVKNELVGLNLLGCAVVKKKGKHLYLDVQTKKPNGVFPYLICSLLLYY